MVKIPESPNQKLYRSVEAVFTPRAYKYSNYILGLAGYSGIFSYSWVTDEGDFVLLPREEKFFGTPIFEEDLSIIGFISYSWWIGVDLDGTLATYFPSETSGLDFIGKPIQPIVDFINKKIAGGMAVKIFTARVSYGQGAIKIILNWLKENGLPVLEITNIKDEYCLQIVDDRAVQVESNTGKFIGDPNVMGL